MAGEDRVSFKFAAKFFGEVDHYEHFFPGVSGEGEVGRVDVLAWNTGIFTVWDCDKDKVVSIHRTWEGAVKAAEVLVA